MDTSKLIEESRRKENLEKLLKEIDENKRKQHEIENEINENRSILHELKLKKETSQELTMENEERMLEDLRKKNIYLTEEVIVIKSD